MIASVLQFSFLMMKSVYQTSSPFKGIGFLTGRYTNGELSLMFLAATINVIYGAEYNLELDGECVLSLHFWVC